MDSDRRYDDEEARMIFAIAGQDSAEASPPDASLGLTLAELQGIGSEAGIHPSLVADAARSIDSRPALLPRKTSLGMLVSAGTIVSLPRRPTELEWTTLVARFRDYFETTGDVRTQGDAREWTNGALRVLLEPTVDGYQLRLTTVNRRFRSLNRVGAMLGVTGLTFLALIAPEAVAAGGGFFQILTRLIPSLIVVGGGLGFVAYSALSLPDWVTTREEQFARLGNEARSLLESTPDEDSRS